MSLQYELLQILVNPNIAFLLLLVGIIGIAIELFSPGLIIPGTLGVVFSARRLRHLAAPSHGGGHRAAGRRHRDDHRRGPLPTNGIVGVIGAVALVASGLLLFDTGSDFDVSTPLVIGAEIVTAGLLGFAIRKVLEASRNPVLTGWEELLGAEGDVRVPVSPLGQVFVQARFGRPRSPTAARTPRRNGCAIGDVEWDIRGCTRLAPAQIDCELGDTGGGPACLLVRAALRADGWLAADPLSCPAGPSRVDDLIARRRAFCLSRSSPRRTASCRPPWRGVQAYIGPCAMRQCELAKYGRSRVCWRITVRGRKTTKCIMLQRP